MNTVEGECIRMVPDTQYLTIHNFGVAPRLQRRSTSHDASDAPYGGVNT